MSTQNSLKHLKEIMGVFGRALSVGCNGGPSYRAQWEEELGALGLFIEHGGARVNKMPTFELIFPRNFLEVNYSSLKFDEKTDNFP